MSNVAGIFIQEHMQMMWNLCISAHGYIIGYSEFIWGVDTDIIVWNLHLK